MHAEAVCTNPFLFLKDCSCLTNTYLHLMIIFSPVIPLQNYEELYDYGFSESSLYIVQPNDNGGDFVVYCDMTVVQTYLLQTSLRYQYLLALVQKYLKS